MLISSFHASVSNSCGISIFSRHLRKVLSSLGVDMLETNLRNSEVRPQSSTLLVHYVPSSFISDEASSALVKLLVSLQENQTLCVILHGVHGRGETRFDKDGVCPNQEHHIHLMSQRAGLVIALSDAVSESFRSWQVRLRRNARVVRLDHPGLFSHTRNAKAVSSYAFVGGISRPKKESTSSRLANLVGQCETRGIRIWQHWSNVSDSWSIPSSWKQTSGLLPDAEWGSLIAGADAVLCPYQTRIQSVSGLIAEAVSAERFVLTTSFDLAVEMQRRAPNLVYIEDNLQRWPDILTNLPTKRGCENIGVPTWETFAKRIAQELLYASHPDVDRVRSATQSPSVRSGLCDVVAPQ